MRRLLASTIGIELAIGLAVATFAGDAPAARPTVAHSAALTLDPAAGPESSAASVNRGRTPGPTRRATIRAAAPRWGDESRASARRTAIAFGMPRHFATGANPSSAEFNRAEGDQIALHTLHSMLPDSVAVGDFDEDGNLDVAQTNVIAGSISIFRGDGRGQFATPQLLDVGAHPSFIVTAHLDPDGHLDLAVANTGSDSVAILRGDGRGGFELAGLVPVPAPRTVAVGRFNDDDAPDLAVASAGPSCPRLAPMCSSSAPSAGGVALFTGRAEPTGAVSFDLAQLIPLTHTRDGQPVGANVVAVADFDGSGLDDLAVGVGTSSNAGARQEGTSALTGDDALIFLNRHQRSPGLFDSTPDQAFRVGAMPEAIAVADWNGDTYPDLAVLGTSSGGITTLLGDAEGHFVVKATNVTVGTLARSLAVGDFNDDGIPDLVTANFGASTISVLQGHAARSGRGDGTFHPAVDFWAGAAPTEAAVGSFDADGRIDVVAARLRTDQLSLLLNDSPAPGDGVVVHRDIPYIDPTNDPHAAHHTLDVYVPPPRTVSFAGKGQPYPVVFFAHGGGGTTFDKSGVNYMMRTLALEGIVMVSTNYRLTGRGDQERQTQDVVAAFGWTRDNIGRRRYGGDPANLFAFGHSAGATAVAKMATDPLFAEEQEHLRGFVLAGCPESGPGNAVDLLPSLLLNGDEGLEHALAPACVTFATEAQRRGAESEHVVVPGRDHLTIISDIALADDGARVAMLRFIRSH